MVDPQRVQAARQLLQQKGYTPPDPARVESAKKLLQQKSQTPTPEPKKDGFFKSLVKDPIKTLLVKPAVRIAQAGIAGYGALTGNQKALDVSTKDANVKIPLLGNYNIPAQKAGLAGVKQVAGDALKAGSYLYTPGAATGLLKQPILGAVKQGAKAGAVGAGSYSAGEALQQNKGFVDTLKDTAKGAVAGAVTGGAIGGAGALASKELTKASALRQTNKLDNTVHKRVGELSKLENSYSTLRTRVQRADTKGFDVKRLLSETDLLANSVDDTGTIRTKEAIAQLNEFIKPQENIVRRSLEKEGRRIPLGMVDSYLKGAVNNSGVKGGAKIRALRNVTDDIAGYSLDADKDGYIPLAILHDAKVDKYANINYLNPETKRVDKALAKGLKELVVKHSKNKDIDPLNKELSKYFTIQDYLEALDGKKVQGGKLGKYFAQTIGSVVGSHFGPLGSIVGAELGGRVRGVQMSSTFGKKTGTALKQSLLMKGAIERSKDTVIHLPQSSNLGKRNISQASTNAPTINPIKDVLSKVNDALNEATPGLYTTSKYNVEYTTKKGEKSVLRNLSRADARGWLKQLEENGYKWAIKVAGAGATAGVLAKNKR